MNAALRHHDLGLTWIEQSRVRRTSHALRHGDEVWLIDPFADDAALEAAVRLGRPAGVLQLLNRHNRDCEAIARRLGVSFHRVPDDTVVTPFQVIPVLNRRGWHEVALWWPKPQALIVADAIGTSPVFACGRRAGVHPLLRLMAPLSQFAGYRPRMLLVGHGRPVESDAAAALDDALAYSRSDLPWLMIEIPMLLFRP